MSFVQHDDDVLQVLDSSSWHEVRPSLLSQCLGNSLGNASLSTR
jgi:hypothetical protein